MKFILKAFVWDIDVDNEGVTEDKTHYTGENRLLLNSGTTEV